ncbi:MAG: hypothetical protein R2828_27120 [Saprospiraceae bacterium]
MKNILVCSLLTVLSWPLVAQSYDVAGGMRLGTDWGITAKYRFAQKTTGELILQSSLQREELMLTLLGEQHSPLISRRFNFYVGGGLHKGWLTPKGEEIIKDPFGLTAIAGIEFTLARLNLTWDFKPAINLVGGEQKMYKQTGVSIRYVFLQKNELAKNKKRRDRIKKRAERKANGEGFNWRFWEKKG